MKIPAGDRAIRYSGSLPRACLISLCGMKSEFMLRLLPWINLMVPD